MIELVLPFPPSINAIWRRSGARIHRSAKYTAWLKEAGWRAKSQRPGKLSGPYRLSIQAARPDKRKRDLDNFAFKAVSDLLVSLGIVNDDSDCEMISARWVTTGEGVTVRVEPAGME